MYTPTCFGMSPVAGTQVDDAQNLTMHHLQRQRLLPGRVMPVHSCHRFWKLGVYIYQYRYVSTAVSCLQLTKDCLHLTSNHNLPTTPTVNDKQNVQHVYTTETLIKHGGHTLQQLSPAVFCEPELSSSFLPTWSDK